MNKLCTGVGMVVGGWLGWMLGDRWGMGTAFVLSSLGSIIGVVVGWKIARRLE